jgi:hypothetical protein
MFRRLFQALHGVRFKLDIKPVSAASLSSWFQAGRHDSRPAFSVS